MYISNLNNILLFFYNESNLTRLKSKTKLFFIENEHLVNHILNVFNISILTNTRKCLMMVLTLSTMNKQIHEHIHLSVYY